MQAHHALRSLPVVTELAARERRLSLTELATLVTEVAGRPLSRELARHDPSQRWYERLLLTEAVDLWLIGWTPGQTTPPHDHDGSSGAMAVADGFLTEEVFSDSQLSSARALLHGPGRTVAFPERHVHRISNQGAGNATSVHAYSPPIGPLRVYGPRTTVEQLLDRARARLVRLDPLAAASALAEGALLVDIRPEAQRRAEGAIPGALCIERNVLEWRLDPGSRWRIPEVRDHDQRIVLVCSEGYTSSLAAAALHELGLVNATDIVGGYRAWAGAGLPVEAAVGA